MNTVVCSVMTSALALLLLAPPTTWAASPQPGDTLKLVTQYGYLPQNPVLVRVELLNSAGQRDREVWDIVATLTSDQPGVTLSTNKVTLHNGLGSALVQFTGGGDFNLTAAVGSLSTNRPLKSLVGVPVTTIGGTLPGAITTWSNVVNVTNTLTVPVNHTLTILSNTLVLINGIASGSTAPGFIVQGSIQSLGTESQPVTFTCATSNLFWGEINQSYGSLATSPVSTYRNTILTKAGNSPAISHTSTGPTFRLTNASNVYENCTLSDNIGKIMYASGSDLIFTNCQLARSIMGPEVTGTGVKCLNTWITEMHGTPTAPEGTNDNDGIYFWTQQAGQIITVADSVIVDCQDDGIDTLGPTFTVTNTIIRDCNNFNEDAKGISLFDCTMTATRCLIVNCLVGVSAKSAGTLTLAKMNHCTITALTNGISAAFKANATVGNIDFRLTNCIVRSTNSVRSDFGVAKITMSYCDSSDPWPGSGNLTANPLFVNAAAGDYHLQGASPCINVGDPASPNDPDGTRTDLGFFAFQAATNTFIALGSNWKYLDNGSNQGTNWQARVFDDSSWSNGLAQLGYSSNPPENDEATIINFGPDPLNKYITYYFRRAFTLTDAASYTNLSLTLLRDDGGVVYLNGVELFRTPNMPAGPILFNTLATLAVENVIDTANVNSALPLLINGTNVIAVEIHQQLATSSDISFDFELAGRTGIIGGGGNSPPSVALTNPANNASFTTPVNVTIDATAMDTDGSVSKVEFFQNGIKLGEDLTSPYSLTWSNVPPGAYALTAVATDDKSATSTSPTVNINVSDPSTTTTNTLISLGSVWKYLDNGSNQGTNWSQPGYDDITWASGPAQLGYGDLDEATVVSFGPDSNNKYITTYFRRAFTVTNAPSYTNLALRLLRDDGGVVYLNGVEIFRSISMPAGPIAFNTLALSPAPPDNTVDIATLPAGTPLLEGTNILAVEIHQVLVTSSDISFDFELTGVHASETNARPSVSITSPANGTIFGTPANFTVTAAASDPEGGLTNVAFYFNGSKAGDDPTFPFSFTTNAIPAGSYALTAVATDNIGQSTTSAVVNVAVSTNVAPPVVSSKTPAPGSVTNLTSVTVTFSKAVAGVNASDLLINGAAATGLSGSGSVYTFTFGQPAYGAVSISWAPGHGIADLFTPPHGFDESGAGAAWLYTLLDSVPPVVTAIDPLPGSSVASLTSISVTFSESVTGVNAGDLVVNSSPATGLTGVGAGPYVFSFLQPALGVVNVAWAGAHGIADLSGNPFSPAPWSYTLDTNSAQVVISEFMFHPSTENVLEEWIEIYNKGAGAQSLSGWKFKSAVDFNFTNVSIPAHGYLVIAANRSAFTNKYPTVTNVVGDWTGTLNKNSDNIKLEDANSNIVDNVLYADDGNWAVRQRGPLDLGHRGWVWYQPHDGGGATLERRNLNQIGSSGQNWGASLTTNGTPGRVNSLNTNNVAPLILEPTHFPTIPNSSDQILISTRIVDEASGGFTATLFWRVDAASPPPFTSAALHDDGLNGDAIANDGLYTARLPAQPNSTISEYYISATDAQGLTRTWPAPAIQSADGLAPGGQVVNALFQIDNAVYAPTNAQPMYKLIMTANEAAELASIPAISTLQGPNSTMNGTFISIDGGGTEYFYTLGFRNRGHGSRTANPPNYKVEFLNEQRWKGRQGLNLNAVFIHIQHLGSVLSRRAGVSGADTTAAQVRVNNANRAVSGQGMFGSYAANEVQDSDYAKAHYPNDPAGDVYRGIRDIAPPDFTYRGENKLSYENTWFKESNASADNWTNLIGMLRVVGIGNTTPFTTANVRAVVNVEQWMRYLAVMNLFGNGETTINRGYNDDYFMYSGMIDPRFLLTYYDLDTILGQGDTPRPSNDDIFSATADFGAGQAFNRFMHWPDFEPIYYQQLRDILTTSFAQSNFNATVDEVLGGYVPISVTDAIKGHMDARRAFVLGVIPPFVVSNAPTAVVTGPPRSPTPITSAALTVGGRNVASYQFSLNGGAYSAETPVATLIALSSLANGTNKVSVLGKGTNGVWQATNNATVLAWVVNTSWPAVRLNEVLAHNLSAVNHNGTFPDVIELFNEGAATVDLGGFRLSNDRQQPSKYTFPGGTPLAPGSNLVVYANDVDGTPGIHLGFNLNGSGDSVHLFHSVASGGAELDSIKFGKQLADLSIGRFGNSGEWKLAQPTFGGANALQPLGGTANLHINEWLAISQAQEDFVELYNSGALPVALGGLFLTDNLLGDPARNSLDALTFMASGEYWALTANGNGNGGDHLNFKLRYEQGEIGLFSGDLTLIDQVIYGPQQPDIAQGLCPNGGVAFTALTTPTPGAPNACPSQPNGTGVVINEVLANNATLAGLDGSKPDWVELYNSSATNVNLGDMSLTDDTMNSRRWVIPAGKILNSHSFLKIRFGSDQPSSSTNTGFGLKTHGGSVYLFNTLATGGSLLSSIAYGIQAADYSIGRVPDGSTNWALTIPSLGGANIAAALGNPSLLKVNEWMANPISGPDYFELYNPNPQPVDISHFYLTDNLSNRTKHPLPALSFIGTGADAFQKFDADGLTAAGADHVSFSLSASGESIGITSASNIPIDGITFGPQVPGVSEGRLPDGTATITTFPTTPTPGKPNFLPLTTVFVNELLSHTDPPLEDAVEIYNPTGDDVDISGWYLSDSPGSLQKYHIPANTVIHPHSYVVFYEYQFNPGGPGSFSFNSSKGDQVYLSQAAAPGVLTGYRAFADFGSSENGVSFGRFQTSLGYDFTAMSARTFGVDNPATTNQFRLGTGLANVYPKVGPVVINEILYHPPGTNDALEFLELKNITVTPVPLYDTNNPANPWRLRKGIDFNFPPNTVIPAGGYLVVVSFDPIADPASLALFQSAYGSNSTLVGPFSGKLSNSGEELEVQKPDAPQTIPGPDFGLVPYIVADHVAYGSTAPWPTTPDGFGDALKKSNASLYGNEPLNWIAGPPTPGAANMPGGSSNTPPVLNPIGDKSGSEGTLLTFIATAIDPDVPAQPLTFTLDAGFPAGAAITSGGVFTWTPDESQGGSNYTVAIRVSDGVTNASETITITVNEVNFRPTLNPVGNKAASEGALLTFTATATDTDVPAQPLTFTLDAGFPTGAGITSSGVFTWTPDESQGGSNYTVTIRVSDGVTNASETITITVNEVNNAPSLAAVSDKAVSVGRTLAFTNSATDTDLPAQSLTFTLDPGAPVGTVLNPTNGVFTWTCPTNAVPATNQVTLRVTDNGTPPASDTQLFRLVVVGAPRFTRITMTTPSLAALEWESYPGKTYRVRYTTNLSDGAWTTLGNDVPSAGATTTTTDSTTVDYQRFYRVLLVD